MRIFLFVVWSELSLHLGYLVGAYNGFYGWFPQ